MPPTQYHTLSRSSLFPPNARAPFSSMTSRSDEEVAYATVSSAPPKRPAGRTKFRETRHPVYRGVRRRNADRWVCEVREPNKKSRIWLGTFPTAEMAARAHDVADMALRGRAACLNFADSAWLLQVPKSTDPREIRTAAAEAAEAFRPWADAGDPTAAEAAGPSSLAAEDPFVLDFGMQGYKDMAEGLLIDPPMPPVADTDDEEGIDVELPLWSHSM